MELQQYGMTHYMTRQQTSRIKKVGIIIFDKNTNPFEIEIKSIDCTS